MSTFPKPGWSPRHGSYSRQGGVEKPEVGEEQQEGVGATPPVAAAQQRWQEETALPSASTHPLSLHSLSAAIFKMVTRLPSHSSPVLTELRAGRDQGASYCPRDTRVDTAVSVSHIYGSGAEGALLRDTTTFHSE